MPWGFVSEIKTWKGGLGQVPRRVFVEFEMVGAWSEPFDTEGSCRIEG